MYITSWRIKPKTKIITQSILLHLEIAVEFCQWENCKQISSVSQSFKIPKHPNKTKQKKTHNQACYTIPSSSSSSSFNTKITTKMQTKTHQDLQPKNNQTKHEFFCNFSNSSNVILNGMGSFWLWFKKIKNKIWGKNTCDETFLSHIIWMREKGIWKFESKLCNPHNFTG